MKKRLIIGLCIVLVIIGLAPFPTRVDIDVAGNQISPSGDILANVSIMIEGWNLHYLFRQDVLKVTAEIKDNETYVIQTIDSTGSISYIDRFIYTTTSSFNAEENCMAFGKLVASSDFHSFLITDAYGELYIASVVPQSDTNTLVKSFQQFLQ